jgi:hypothetical protein
MASVLLTVLALTAASSAAICRNQPGDPGFPSLAEWQQLNSTVNGRLVPVVPFAGYCKTLPGGQCTPEQYGSSVLRKEVPGAMNYVCNYTFFFLLELTCA